MMTHRKLADYISAEPFRPFCINMASGQSYQIRHPENIMVSRSTAKVFLPGDEPNGDERWHDVSLTLIESIEPLEATIGSDDD